jgi:translation initiation factor IF-3
MNDVIITYDNMPYKEVRLIDDEGEQLGVVSTKKALVLTSSKNLDLILMSDKANPPVCKMMDYGKYKYEKSKKDKEIAKNSSKSELKEIWLRPVTEEHDLQIKLKKVQEFLGKGNKVKIGIKFRGREMAHKKIGKEILENLKNQLYNTKIDKDITDSNRMMFFIVAPVKKD